MGVMTKHCSVCDREWKPLIKGRCRTCYHYFYRNGKERPYRRDGRAERFAPKPVKPPKPTKPLLTAREQEVMELVVSGMGNAAIAAHIGRSVKTVEAHKAHINHKLGVSNGTQAVVLWVERRILERARLGSIAA
jgi:DNA-binding NarL/FixJ family response regulator